jgi:hypothetical protein
VAATQRLESGRSASFADAAIHQGGDSFGVDMAIGTKDAHDLLFKADDIVRWRLGSEFGGLTPEGDGSQSIGAFNLRLSAITANRHLVFAGDGVNPTAELLDAQLALGSSSDDNLSFIIRAMGLGVALIATGMKLQQTDVPTQAADMVNKAYADSLIVGGSPLTTKGDIYTYSSTNARLPVGADGLLLFADSGVATGLAWSDLDRDGFRIKGMFLNNTEANGVGFVVDRYGTGRQSGYEWWANGDALWAAGLDFVSTDLVLVCDIATGTGSVHDLIRIKQGGAIKISNRTDETAIPDMAYRLWMLAAAEDNEATKQMLRLECGYGINIPLYIKNSANTHMLMMENAAGDVWRVSAANPSADPYVALGPSLADGTAGNPTLFQFHSDGRFSAGTTAAAPDAFPFFATFHGPSSTDGASRFQLALVTTDAYNSSTRGGGFWVAGEYTSAHDGAGFGGVSVYKETTASGHINTVIALCNRPDDTNAPIAERLRITGDGVTWINGGDNNTRLYVQGKNSGAAQFSLVNAAGTLAYGFYTTFGASGEQVDLHLYDGGAGTDRMTLTKDGYMTFPVVRLGFFDAAAVVKQSAVADAAGGIVVDAEARTALNALLARIRNYGLIAA